MKRTVAVVGGDMRQVRLAELLLNDGWLVCTWGLDQGGGSNAVPLDQALGAELLILPLPVCRGGRGEEKNMFQGFSESELCLMKRFFKQMAENLEGVTRC